MITVLKKLGVEPLAVEQPLDLSIPENKMMMAFYLAIPEVENARRALNVKQGIWKARKEGKWVGAAPLGYENKSTETGVKYIAPKEPQASLMKRAFEMLAEGRYNVSQVYDQVSQDGLGRFSNAFRRALRNPVYCGKVKVPAFENEMAFFIQGIHEPIISEQLFDLVQKIIEKKQYSKREKTAISYHFPFRGLLICPMCGKILTGSASRGKSGKQYHYYHCLGKCTVRFRAERVEEDFVKGLKIMSPINDFQGFIKEQMQQISLDKFQLKKSKQDILMARINDRINRIQKAEDLMLQGVISGDDYRRIKADIEVQINILGEQVAFIQGQTNDIDRMTKKAVKLIGHLHELFWMLNTQSKRQLIDLLFPKGLVFEFNRFMPCELGVPARIVYGLDIMFKEKS